MKIRVPTGSILAQSLVPDSDEADQTMCCLFTTEHSPASVANPAFGEQEPDWGSGVSPDV